ncbi:MAG: hypothetical protein DRQ78_00100 [Epsilonproteobacteria bacterium]|nr:MAG: hypothetical protein DRQ78_00100 [Campylobacterota bacterium]
MDNVYNQPIVKVSSASTITEQRNEEKRLEAIEKFILAGGATLGIYIAGQSALQTPSIKKFFTNSVLNSSMEETAQGRGWNSMFPKDIAKPSHTVLEGIRKIEELSPFRVMRTLQLSHALTPFVAGKDVSVDISGKTIRMQEGYFRNLLANRGMSDLEADHMQYGLRLEKGKLFSITSTGETGKQVAKEARLIMPHFSLPKDSAGKELTYVNKILKQYSTIIGAGQTDQFDNLIGGKTSPYLVVAGKTHNQIAYDMFRSYGRAVMEQGAKVFDNPLEHMTEMFSFLDDKPWFQKVKQFSKIGLGTGGVYRQSMAASLGIMAYRQIGLVEKIELAKMANTAIETIAPEDSGFSKGFIPGVATVGVNAQITLAEAFSDHFQDYKNTQEHYAPGSTSLLALAGAPIAMGTAAATASFTKRIYDNAQKGIEVSERNAEKVGKLIPDFIGEFLPDTLANSEGGRAKRWGTRAALVGLALVAPFIPGALIGRSSEDLIGEYSGRDDVAIRKNRWWFTGSGAYGGDEIKYFDKGAYAKMMAQTSTKADYGDRATQRALDPIRHPFDYIRNPYATEQLNAELRPYPVMGMDISTGAFLGKAFEKTIGQVIKPDIINPRLAEEIAAESGAVSASSGDIKKALKTGTYSLNTPVTRDEASLIAEEKLIAPESATYEPNKEAATWSYEAFKDFIGLRGWLLGELEEAMSIPDVAGAPQLARSGEMSNMGRKVREANVGGLFGLTEPQRRYIPTSANLTTQRVNPIKNAMPSWLPGDDDEFWLNLQRGDAYTKVEHGDSRLPGVGYASLHTELEGVNPEDYPDIYKMKILSDVAMGSDAYYNIKNVIDSRERKGSLSQRENSMLLDIREKEFLKSEKRQFSEYKTGKEKEGASFLQKLGNDYWEMGAHNLEKSLPSEFLTFFRPAGKMVHQRSAIEDYERTQLEGSDMAIWTKPYQHFIKPAGVSARRLIDDDFISEEVQDKRAVNRYFDTLEYVKQRRIYKNATSVGDMEGAREARAAYQSTTEGAIASGIDTDQEVLRSYVSLPKDEKPYFSSFVNAKEEDRLKIAAIVPKRVSNLYSTIWDRKDRMETAIVGGASAAEASQIVQRDVQQEDTQLRKNNTEQYSQWQRQGGEQSGTFREHLADIQAEQYISATTGMPGEDFSGWDPRIDLDKVKLRALTIGDEDFFKYGFWDDDVKELQRYTSVMQDENINIMTARLKDSMKADIVVQDMLEDQMYREGYSVRRMTVGNDSSGIDINMVNN